MPRQCQTSLAAVLSSGVSGGALAIAQAYRDHVPTIEERKLITALWTFAIVGYEDGVFDTSFMASDIATQLASMQRSYPSFFIPCGSQAQSLPSAKAVSTPVGKAGASLHLLVHSCKDFSCNADCRPDGRLFPKLQEKIAEVALSAGGKALLDEPGLAKLRALRSKMVQKVAERAIDIGSSQGAAQYRETIVGAQTGDEEVSVMTMVSQLLTSFELLTKAASIVGGASVEAAVAADVAAVAGLVGTLLAFFGLGYELGHGLALVVDCLKYEANCAAVPPLAQPCGCPGDIRCSDGPLRGSCVSPSPGCDWNPVITSCFLYTTPADCTADPACFVDFGGSCMSSLIDAGSSSGGSSAGSSSGGGVGSSTPSGSSGGDSGSSNGGLAPTDAGLDSGMTTPSPGSYVGTCTVTHSPITCCSGGMCSTGPATTTSSSQTFRLPAGTSLSQVSSDLCSNLTAALSASGCSGVSCGIQNSTANSFTVVDTCVTKGASGCTDDMFNETCAFVLQ
jgi:hypothetical protein